MVVCMMLEFIVQTAFAKFICQVAECTSGVHFFPVWAGCQLSLSVFMIMMLAPDWYAAVLVLTNFVRTKKKKGGGLTVMNSNNVWLNFLHDKGLCNHGKLGITC